MATRGRRAKSKSQSRHLGEPELIVVAKPDAGLRATPSGLKSVAGADTASLNKLCSAYGSALRPLFGLGEERLLRQAARASAATNLAVYYRADAPKDRLDELAGELREQPLVQGAYVKPPAELPQLNDMPPLAEEAPAATPDFFSLQEYLRPAPGGIDVNQAWAFSGGKGAKVRIVDIEGAWRFTHEDLFHNAQGAIGTEIQDLGWRNHGTAVLGVLGGDENGFGVTGICPAATLSAISQEDMGSAAAIVTAANHLRPGDIILIEIHRAGPRNNFESREDQHGYIAIEWWPDDFDAIRFAVTLGVIVVEAAGNGAQGLDDPIYNTPAPGFPPNWSNPFSRGNRDSGAILVGAGAPPPGTHGRNHGPDRSRLDFSNFGVAVDAQGWGREVTSCGYGDLQGGSNEDVWYTNLFGGTSSASPIIAGTLACLQGILRERGAPDLTPPRARELLRITGSPQQDARGRPSTQRIGTRPDLRSLLAEIEPELVKALKDSTKDSKEKDGKDSKEKEVKEPKDSSKEKEFKDSKEKEGKDKEKDKESSGEVAKAHNEFVGHHQMYMSAGMSIADRLARLEHSVAQLAHFISPQLRPDLSASALAYETQAQKDVRALSADLQRRAEQAKHAKDSKDLSDR